MTAQHFGYTVGGATTEGKTATVLMKGNESKTKLSAAAFSQRQAGKTRKLKPPEKPV